MEREFKIKIPKIAYDQRCDPLFNRKIVELSEKIGEVYPVRSGWTNCPEILIRHKSAVFDLPTEASIEVSEFFEDWKLEGNLPVPSPEKARELCREIEKIKTYGKYLVEAYPCKCTEIHPHLEEYHVHFFCKPREDQVERALMQIIKTYKEKYG